MYHHRSIFYKTFTITDFLMLLLPLMKIHEPIWHKKFCDFLHYIQYGLFCQGLCYQLYIMAMKMEIENYSYFLTFPASTMAWILKWITSSNLTSSFRYKIWNVFVTAVPLIIQAGKAMSEAARKCYRYKLSCWLVYFSRKVWPTYPHF